LTIYFGLIRWIYNGQLGNRGPRKGSVYFNWMTYKLYCYVDETGQDTKGRLFLVAVVLKEISDLTVLENELIEVEQKAGKNSKWKKTEKRIKKKYLEGLIGIKGLKGSIFYSSYESTKEYSKLTSLTIAKAVLAKEKQDYTVTVIIDGLNERERDLVRCELKKLRVKYRKIRGMKDEQSVFLRLADAMAGFLREREENEIYTIDFIGKFETLGVITEI